MKRIRIAFLGVHAGALLSACVSAPPAAQTTQTGSGSAAATTAANTSSQLLNEARGFVYRVRSVACLAVGTSFVTDGVEAPICQDGSSSRRLEGLSGAVIGHDVLVDLSGQEPLEAPDDLSFS